MHAFVKINQYRERKEGTDLVVSVPDLKLGDMLQRKRICNAEIRFDDGRHISAEQRKKAYATIRDISDWTGYLPHRIFNGFHLECIIGRLFTILLGKVDLICFHPDERRSVQLPADSPVESSPFETI